MIDIVEGNIPTIRELCVKHNVRKLSVFGSATDGSFDPERSDIDVLVDFAPMLPKEKLNHYMKLAEGLERLFGRSVDLVVRNAIDNPYFLRAVERSESVIYDAA